jgi:hypothetical protein
MGSIYLTAYQQSMNKVTITQDVTARRKHTRRSLLHPYVASVQASRKPGDWALKPLLLG